MYASAMDSESDMSNSSIHSNVGSLPTAANSLINSAVIENIDLAPLAPIQVLHIKKIMGKDEIINNFFNLSDNETFHNLISIYKKLCDVYKKNGGEYNLLKMSNVQNLKENNSLLHYLIQTSRDMYEDNIVIDYLKQYTKKNFEEFINYFLNSLSLIAKDQEQHNFFIGGKLTLEITVDNKPVKLETTVQ
jgi:hypothetical protein